MENKNEENQNKIILGDFNCTMDKIERDGRYKHFINVISIMPCQNSSWKLTRRSMEKGVYGYRNDKQCQDLSHNCILF